MEGEIGEKGKGVPKTWWLWEGGMEGGSGWARSGKHSLTFYLSV